MSCKLAQSRPPQRDPMCDRHTQPPAALKLDLGPVEVSVRPKSCWRDTLTDSVASALTPTPGLALTFFSQVSPTVSHLRLEGFFLSRMPQTLAEWLLSCPYLYPGLISSTSVSFLHLPHRGSQGVAHPSPSLRPMQGWAAFKGGQESVSTFCALK